ncbi:MULTISPECIES: acyltransferase family protein [Legionella]|uniref:O-acetyltransferase n=1 Tax=Legionella drozanskii LLAP-1 TaxID=1212489 RepID=A0A0W0SPQ2_9GAMM|nr:MULTISPECIES: acyltransferase [Legionella]KTC85383.1 O-acetyltransferase [Legionella drozanskii LLAP-1]PJE13959.1 MAG: acyltransferase [Legionella sp.]
MQNEILTLTSLRFVAAFYLFLFHIQLYIPLFSHGSIARFLSEGACGMSLFFILSGFVLGYRFHDGVSNYKKYAFNRFTRIYPAYFLAALVTIPWLISSLSFTESNQTFRYLYVIFANLLMIQAWIPQLFTTWNNGGSWSLCVEMFFYALFPFFIAHLKKLSTKQLFIALIVFYLSSALPGFSLLLFNPIPSNIMFYSLPIFRVSEFLIGVICGLLFAREVRVAHSSICAILSMLQLYYYLARGPAYGHIAIAQNFATVPLITILIFSLASLTSGRLYAFMTHRSFIYLGRISYSFYSFQALILMTVVSNHNEIVSRFPLLTNNVILATLAFFILIAISTISHQFVEIRFRNYLNKKYKKARYVISSLPQANL